MTDKPPSGESMPEPATEHSTESGLEFIVKVGWRGLCPRCGKGAMFQSWLKISDECDVCGLDYKFASPDDGPAFFSLVFAAFPLLFIVVWMQVSYELSVAVVLAIAIPLMAIGCALPLRPIKGWLVASQYRNRSVEAGTEELWNKLHEQEKQRKTGQSEIN